jgi:hypothetical protein
MVSDLPAPETNGAVCFGPRKAVVVPSGHDPSGEAPGRAVLGAQYAGLLSATAAYAEKVRTQFLSLRHE